MHGREGRERILGRTIPRDRQPGRRSG
jgi:hypothetical protein